MTIILGEVEEVQEGQAQAQDQRQRKSHHAKKSVACDYCRLKKVKCESQPGKGRHAAIITTYVLTVVLCANRQRRTASMYELSGPG
ncbi:hypothetical protein ACEPPN_018757 [Leptodophora sp. 'Broadleaf-Isolate-01']